jgi:hypothetical protein
MMMIDSNNFFEYKNDVDYPVDSLFGKLVGVHWNAHRKTFSIVEMKSKNTLGKVIGYSDYVTLENCYPLILKSEQKKVREGEHKNRHAFIIGNVVDFDINAYSNTLYYNPNNVNSFVDKLQFTSGNKYLLDSMDKVALAKVPSKERPLVTYNRGVYEIKEVTS